PGALSAAGGRFKRALSRMAAGLSQQSAQEPLRPKPAVPVSSTYKWWVVFMLWFICLFNYADRQAIFSVFPKLKEEFGFDKVQLGLIGSAFMWVYAAGA